MKRLGLSFIGLILLGLAVPVSTGAEDAPGQAARPGEAALPEFPVITRLDPRRDAVFKQYTAEVEAARRRLKTVRQRPPARQEPGEAQAAAITALAEELMIYAYTPQGEDILSLAARCNIPYDALITLNRLPHLADFDGSGIMLLPSIPGLFIPETPKTDLELLLRASRDTAEGITVIIRRGTDTGERFLFIPGVDGTAQLSPTERTFFLNSGFHFPLKNYRVTSTFGPRTNPVTGNLRVHQGLDLAAPLGTSVYPAKAGTVIKLGYDPIYGNYVIVQHSGNWTSLYGHLSEISTALQKDVQSGTLIGKVGSTGQSTGPHLHFELRQDGTAQDPGKYLLKEGSRR
jgi:hypothetical protein